jgi:uncharacterized protein YjbJ (UPF0337 family)
MKALLVFAATETEGMAEKAEGHVRSGFGKAMDAVREIVNKE